MTRCQYGKDKRIEMSGESPADRYPEFDFVS